MKKFNNLNELIKDIESLNWNGGIYCNLESWYKSPNKTEMYFITGEEEMESDVDENGNPQVWTKYSVKPLFIEVETFKDVINNCKSANYIKCINHYREFDSFIE